MNSLVLQCLSKGGPSAHVCLRSEQIILLRPERLGKSSDENAVQGTLIRESNDGMMVTIYFRADDMRLMSEQDYDLQIELPMYIYERLDLAHRRTWTVSLRMNAIHLMPANVEQA